GAAERGGSLCTAVANEHRIALPRFQSVDGRQKMRDKARTAQHGAFYECGANAEMLNHRHGPHGGRYTGGRDAVNVLHGQARIRHCAVCRLHQDLHFSEAGGISNARMTDARDGGTAPESFVNHCATSGRNTTSFPVGQSAMAAFTGMSIRTFSGGRPSTRLIMRTPSSRSIGARW